MNTDDAKDEVCRLVSEQVEMLISWFASAFLLHGFRTSAQKTDLLNAEVCFTFDYYEQPSSDMLRHIIFSVYKNKWGGKPKHFECIFKRYRVETTPPFGSGSGVMQEGTILKVFILANWDRVSSLVGEGQMYCCDQTAYTDWVRKGCLFHEANRPEANPIERIGYVTRQGLFKP